MSVRSSVTPSAPSQRRSLRVRGPGASPAEDTSFSVSGAVYDLITTRKKPTLQLLTRLAKMKAEAARSRQPARLTVEMDPAGNVAIVEEATPERSPVSAQRALPHEDALDRALAAARERGTRRAAEILSGPEMLSGRALGELIGASHETVNQRRRAGDLLALQGATRGWRYPSWQVGPSGQPLPGLAQLTRLLGGEPWTAYRFLLQPHGELGGRTGLEALQAGRVDEVVAVADGIASGTFT